MHALTTAAPAPRVWLITRPLVQVSPARTHLARSDPRFFHSLVAGILFGLAAIALFTLVALARDVQLFVIDGDGLEPSIPSGSLIFVSPAGDRLLTVGEIVALPGSDGAQVPGYITEVAHGPDGIRYGAYVTGDAATEPRANLDASTLGRVGFYIPGAAMALDIILGPIGQVIAFGLATGAVTFRLGPLLIRQYRPHRPSPSVRWMSSLRRLTPRRSRLRWSLSATRSLSGRRFPRQTSRSI